MDIDHLNKNVIKLIKTYDVKRRIFINDINNDKYINQTIEKIYVINLETDQIRRNYMIRLLEKYGINFEIIIVPTLSEDQYNCVDKSNMKIGEVGCYLSHLYCMYDAIQNDYSNIIIFEDDIILHKNFHTMFENVMRQHCKDIVLLGTSDFDFYKGNSVLNGIVYTTSINNTTYGIYGVYYSNAGFMNVFRTRLIQPNIMDHKLLQMYASTNLTYNICLPPLLTTDWTTTNLNHHFGVDDEIIHNIYLKRCYNNNFDYNNYNSLFLSILKKEYIDKNKTFRENIDYCLAMKNYANISYIKEKIAYDFFTVDDIIFMLNI